MVRVGGSQDQGGGGQGLRVGGVWGMGSDIMVGVGGSWGRGVWLGVQG